MTNTTTEPRGLSMQEAADRLGISRGSLKERVREGRVKAVKLGTRTIISSLEVDRILGMPDPQPRTLVTQSH